MNTGKVKKNSWQEKVKEIKQKIFLLYLALKHKDVPFYSKLIIGIVLGYALSPIDLVPDFIPILGYLDDVILLPIGIMAALKTIPDEILVELTKITEEEIKESWLAGAVIILLWIIIIGFIIYKLFI